MMNYDNAGNEASFTTPNQQPLGLYNPPVCYCIPSANKPQASTWIVPQLGVIAATAVLAYFQ